MAVLRTDGTDEQAGELAGVMSDVESGVAGEPGRHPSMAARNSPVFWKLGEHFLNRGHRHPNYILAAYMASGEIVITRYRVIELIRKLDEPAGESSSQPDGLIAGIGHEVQLARTDTGTWPALCGP